MTGRPTSALRLLLTLAAFACLVPSAAAQVPPIGTPPAGEDDGPSPVQMLALVEEALDQLSDTIRMPRPDQVIDAEFDVWIECRTNEETGQTECQGKVCYSSGGRGDVPVWPTDPGQEGIGVQVDPSSDGDGTYGPYDHYYVSKSGSCGCTSWFPVQSWIAA